MARKRNAGQNTVPDAATLTALKAHCHIDHNSDDGQLSQLYNAAVEYLAGAGVTAPETPSERYNLCVFSLVNDWYDGVASLGTCTVGLRQLINQLKLDGIGAW